jgi:hypothetical protein
VAHHKANQTIKQLRIGIQCHLKQMCPRKISVCDRVLQEMDGLSVIPRLLVLNRAKLLYVPMSSPSQKSAYGYGVQRIGVRRFPSELMVGRICWLTVPFSIAAQEPLNTRLLSLTYRYLHAKYGYSTYVVSYISATLTLRWKWGNTTATLHYASVSN